MLGEFTLTLGALVTVTVDTAVFVQPFVVPVTVYVVVVVNAGVVGFDTAVKPPVQLYPTAPLALKLAVLPLQILGEFTLTLGLAFTVILIDVVPAVVQPVTVPLRFTVISALGVKLSVVPLVVPVWLDVQV
jgi:hypothetical protein